ncbi:CFA_G0047480.mRNA.1.CDS.1 [Saccharomyces cerevisiae]|nr:CFA_G0047480.mRNA.1.CDS.1 [Saccharomyces cerevisiae]CAI7450552.1 CFA_G0047480.mRNA.1.CDS.1 [Saccharomyces cerevisiae]
MLPHYSSPHNVRTNATTTASINVQDSTSRPMPPKVPTSGPVLLPLPASTSGLMLLPPKSRPTPALISYAYHYQHQLQHASY